MGQLLFVSYSGAFGGAERVLLEAVQSAGAAACLACPEGPLADRARAARVSVLALPARPLRLRARRSDRVLALVGLAGHARELRALAVALDAEAVVAWGMRSAVAALGLPGSTALAIGHQDMLPGPLIAAAVRTTARRARLVLVPSRAVADDLDRTGGLARRGTIEIVAPGVAVDRFSAQRAPAEPPEVLVLGALVAWKRPELALEVAAIARRAVPQLRLRFVGEPLDGDRAILARLGDRAAALGVADAIELAGATERPERDLARAACLLHCAPREPFGLVVAEALAAGCPAVVPDAGGPAEIVDESCARLYPAGDASGAAQAVIELLGEPRRARAMGEAGRQRARARFGEPRARAQFARALHGRVWTPRPPGERRAGAQLTIVTVTHNSGRVLGALLDSVARHLPGAQVIVVDSRSSDDSLAVARAHPSVTTVALTENVGYGRASNRGIEAVNTPVTVLLNPDVELLDDSLDALAAEALRAGPPPRLLAPLVLGGDGRRQDTVHAAPGSVGDLVRALVPPAVVAGPVGTALAPWRARRPRAVGWAVGCALVAQTGTLRELGPFDETIFMYGEDMELGLRAARGGIETWLWPAARVVHHRAHATREAFGGEAFERLARARHDAVARAAGPHRARLDDRVQAVTFASRIAIKRALRRPHARELRQLEAVRAVRRAGAG